MNKKIFMIVITLIVISTAIPLNSQGRGIGVGPAVLILEDALRGAEYNRTIFLYNYNNFDANITLNPTGEVSGWLTFYSINNTNQSIKYVIVPKQNFTKILIRINIPENISNGLYSGTVFATLLPEDVNISNMSTTVTLKMPIELSINVTGVQDLNATIESIVVEKTEIGYPLNIKIGITNTGNVIARPKIIINITKDDVYVDRIVYQKDNIPPGEFKQIIVAWNTTNMVAGTYIGNLTILLGKKTLLTKDVTLRILPQGSLTSSGELVDLKYEGTPAKGKTIKIIAKFKNTGQLRTSAKFVGEVYLNEQLHDVLESQELIVEKYSTRILKTYLKINEEGRYIIKGYVVYSGKTTNVKKLVIQVGLPLSISPILIGGTVIGISVTVFIFLVKREEISKIKIIKKISNIVNNNKGKK
jgi:hypothetical protein